MAVVVIEGGAQEAAAVRRRGEVHVGWDGGEQGLVVDEELAILDGDGSHPRTLLQQHPWPWFLLLNLVVVSEAGCLCR